MRYFLITNNEKDVAELRPYPNVIPMIDIETIGKKERQPGTHHHFSTHVIEDLAVIRRHLPPERCLIRINPWHDKSTSEIETALQLGAGAIMLPMYTRRSEVQSFCDAVRGRAEGILLAETPASVLRFETYSDLLVGGFSIHLGLNDLSLALGLNHMFETLSSGFVEFGAKKFLAAAVPFGIGGVGLSSKDLVPASLILEAHNVLGSQAVILSRSFLAEAKLRGFEAAFSEIETLKAKAPESCRPMKLLYEELRLRLDASSK